MNIKYEYERRWGSWNATKCFKMLVSRRRFRHELYFQMYHSEKNHVIKIICRVLYKLSGRKWEDDISINTSIGKGFVVMHPYGIVVHPKTVIGSNVTIQKGVTLGQNYGKTPRIGNNVYVGINSTIIGGVSIGDDVLIAPNTFVNFDVPSHSIVIGEKAKIHLRYGAVQSVMITGEIKG